MKNGMRAWIVTAVCLALAGVVAGCGDKAAEEARRQEEEARRAQVLALLEQWEALADNAAENLQNDEGTQILIEMMRLSDAGHVLILDKLRDPASDPATKVLAMHSLMPLVRADTEGVLLVPQIRELAETTDDPLTLAGALQLLAAPGLEELRPIFEQHADAEDTNVRLNAIAGLAQLGDEDARARLVAMAEDNGLEPLQRDRALFEAMGAGEVPDRDLLKRAVEADYTTAGTKANALLLLGEHGDASDRMYLLELRDREWQSALVTDALDLALARLNERVQEAAVPDAASDAEESPAADGPPQTGAGVSPDGASTDAPPAESATDASDGEEQPPAP